MECTGNDEIKGSSQSRLLQIIKINEKQSYKNLFLNTYIACYFAVPAATELIFTSWPYRKTIVSSCISRHSFSVLSLSLVGLRCHYFGFMWNGYDALDFSVHASTQLGDVMSSQGPFGECGPSPPSTQDFRALCVSFPLHVLPLDSIAEKGARKEPRHTGFCGCWEVFSTRTTTM